MGGGRERLVTGGTHDLLCRSHKTVDLAPLQRRVGARRVFRRTRFAIDHRGRSTVMCTTSRMTDALHPARIV